jgi:hypothetical protein
MTSKGCVVNVVTTPATDPFAKLTAVFCLISFFFSKSFKTLYVPIRKAVAEACFKVVPINPRYKPRIPCSFQIVVVACQPDRNRLSFRASSMRAVLMRSDGVTAVTDAATPAVMPASRLRRGERVPVTGSAKASLIWSKNRKRTPSLPIEPYNMRWSQTLCRTCKCLYDGQGFFVERPKTTTDEARRKKQRHYLQGQAVHSPCTTHECPPSGRPASQHRKGSGVSVRLSLASIVP